VIETKRREGHKWARMLYNKGNTINIFLAVLKEVDSLCFKLNEKMRPFPSYLGA
jgi:hypothetical protein